MNYRLLITLIIAVVLFTGTVIAIRFAQGYRYNLKSQTMEGNGLLVVNSIPKGASVYIDNQLQTATDDTLHMAPGNYNVKIEKDGYSVWNKDLTIEKELVTQINARLFPNVPDLAALTVSGASNITPSPDGHSLVFQIATGSAQTKYGIWITSMNEGVLRSGSNAVQIIKDIPSLEFSKAKLFWNPNSSEILVYFSETQSYLVPTSGEQKVQNLINVSLQLPLIVEDWQKQMTLQQQKRLVKLPIQMQQIATQSATLLYFSPNEKKLIYVATQSAVLADNLIPPLPAINSQPQQRQLTPGTIYLYDSEEDTNFAIATNYFDQKTIDDIARDFSLPVVSEDEIGALPSTNPSNKVKTTTNETGLALLKKLHLHYSPVYSPMPYQWFPDSSHLILTGNDYISLLEYDGTNEAMVYSGVFLEKFAYPWPNGQKLIILTSLNTNPHTFANLYGLNLE